MVSKKKTCLIIMLSGLLICNCVEGCSSKNTEQQTIDPEVTEISVPNLVDYCIDEEEKYLYLTQKGEMTVYRYTLEGEAAGEYPFTADEDLNDIREYLPGEEEEKETIRGLCLNENKIYGYREAKGTVLEYDIENGKERVCAVLENGLQVLTADAGEKTLMLSGFLENERVIFLVDTTLGEITRVPVDYPTAVASAGKDRYWINTYENHTYCFRLYDGIKKELSDACQSNFTYGLDDMVYDKQEEVMYGHMIGDQYVKFKPDTPQIAARYTAQNVMDSPSNIQYAQKHIYVKSVSEQMIYSFNPAAYVKENKPLKGYATSEMALADWGGYQIELEVISWEELALKMLAGDSDYDFVITTTDMAQTETLRNAMMYAAIPEDMVSEYFDKCYPCIREGALYNGDIWMLPLQIRVKGIVYSEENLEKYGIHMDEIHTMPQLGQAADILYRNGQRGKYELNPSISYLLQDYIRTEQEKNNETGGNISFDTEEFRELLAFVHSEYGVDAECWNSEFMNSSSEYLVDGEWTYEKYEAARQAVAQTVCMEEVDGSYWEYAKYDGTSELQVCAIPGLKGETAPQITADVLIVNPNAPNLDVALQYVSDMSRAYISVPDRFLSGDRSIYPQGKMYDDLFDMLQKGVMVFNLPDALFDSYYEYCLNGTLTEEEVIEELDRTVKMYMYE